ncbi:hypothetical protein LINPERPRIM_LOCUS6718, partial [Linum perenne]
ITLPSFYLNRAAAILGVPSPSLEPSALLSSAVAPLPSFQVDADAASSLRRSSQPHHRRGQLESAAVFIVVPAVRRPPLVLLMPSSISIQPCCPLNQPLPPFFPMLPFSSVATVRGPAASVEA